MSKLQSYDPLLRASLYLGFTKGFDVGFRGHVNSKSEITNLKSCNLSPEAVSKFLNSEVSLGRMAGPFSKPPFEYFQVSPIGLVPKKDSDNFRLIMDLSSPSGSSINDFIHDIFSQVTYSSIADAVKLVVQCGPGAFLSKTDLADAFRLLPLAEDQYNLSLVKWNGVFWYNKVLMFGLRSSCANFEKFSCALEFIAKEKGIQHVCHYLDDFLFVNSSFQECEQNLNDFISICSEINVPLASHKTVQPTQKLTFLGFEIDTINEILCLPKDKLSKCTKLIQEFLAKPKVTLQRLESLLGLLSFCCQVIVPGRAFLRHLYSLTRGITNPHCHISLTLEAREDLRVWLLFLESYNGVTLYKDEMFLSESSVEIYADACQSYGMGAFLYNHWFSVNWPDTWWTQQNITFLELLPLVLALEVWGVELRNKCVTLRTDNWSLMHSINSQKSKEPLVMSLLRKLVLLALRHNVLIRSIHIVGLENRAADCLSRGRIQEFFTLRPNSDLVPSAVGSVSRLLTSLKDSPLILKPFCQL